MLHTMHKNFWLKQSNFLHAGLDIKYETYSNGMIIYGEFSGHIYLLTHFELLGIRYLSVLSFNCK